MIKVNNGAIADFQTVGTITPESYQKQVSYGLIRDLDLLTSVQFDINVRAIIFLSQAAVAHMGDGGRIINISSIAGRQGNPGSTGQQLLSHTGGS